MIGAYPSDEMIGFIMLGNAGNFGLTGQIISEGSKSRQIGKQRANREGR